MALQTETGTLRTVPVLHFLKVGYLHALPPPPGRSLEKFSPGGRSKIQPETLM